MAKVEEESIILLDDKDQIKHIEVGMQVVWVDRQEGAFGFDYSNKPSDYAVIRFFRKCRRILRSKK